MCRHPWQRPGSASCVARCRPARAAHAALAASSTVSTRLVQNHSCLAEAHQHSGGVRRQQPWLRPCSAGSRRRLAQGCRQLGGGGKAGSIKAWRHSLVESAWGQPALVAGAVLGVVAPGLHSAGEAWMVCAGGTRAGGWSAAVSRPQRACCCMAPDPSHPGTPTLSRRQLPGTWQPIGCGAARRAAAGGRQRRRRWLQGRALCRREGR